MAEPSQLQLNGRKRMREYEQQTDPVRHVADKRQHSPTSPVKTQESGNQRKPISSSPNSGPRYRQNAHFMALSVRGVVNLFRFVKCEAELHRQILAFSVSHDHRDVRIYGHYPVVNGERTTYYRHSIRQFNFTKLRSAIDELPDVDSNMLQQPETPYQPEVLHQLKLSFSKSTGLSQGAEGVDTGFKYYLSIEENWDRSAYYSFRCSRKEICRSLQSAKEKTPILLDSCYSWIHDPRSIHYQIRNQGWSPVGITLASTAVAGSPFLLEMLKVLYIRHRRLLIIQVYMEFSDQLFTTRNPVVSRLSDRFPCDKGISVILCLLA
ncbi:conserved hypothetical protein [Histoplasma capsulatum G186AR]|uniref:DUF7924 domain-containing protein n=1 Tax=Ajellomyces capsulatus (strain G186AR / H82 / ATCC MYA-2454 / RMSCC 2432) TaxID=447093 RepID=C0NCE4_AJECG|nr:uncharacterized protein HCBG_00790 [Histoplasma capsulatum G186AR]EEH11335.1 conserved hypothetical protein [Histoplasma capsulatum G186AR]